MRILSYSPSVEVYVAADRNGSVRYYDLSKDVSSCTVSRSQDGISTFSVKLLNEGGKYDAAFMPMDRVTIFASKRERRLQVFTGYINSVSRFTLYPQDFTMSGSCSLYRLQKLYWDPGLPESVAQFVGNGQSSYEDGFDDYVTVLKKLVVNIGGMQTISIGSVPQSVEDAARDLYAAQATDLGNLQAMLKQFDQMLSRTNVSVGGVVAPAGKGIEAAVQWALATADDPNVGYAQDYRQLNPDVDCSSFVWYALVKGGGFDSDKMGGYPFATGGMTSVLEGNGFVKVAWDGDSSKLARGDIMWVHGTSRQHTEIYIGDGKTVGAHSNSFGGIKGDQGGDQTGNEVSVVSLSTSFTHYFRYVGDSK